MRTTAVLALATLTSCTTAGRIGGALSVASLGTGTLLIANDQAVGFGVSLLELGVVYGIVALVHEISTATQSHGTPVISVGDGSASAATCDDGECTGDATTSGSPQSNAASAPGGAFAAGSTSVTCSFGDCTKNGSTGWKDGETVDTRCAFGDCNSNGWTTTSGSTRSDTMCNFGDCNSNGWTTTSGSTRSDTMCNFGDCNSNGWTTTSSDGSRSDTRCSFGDCNKNGWTTTDSSGHSVTCTCRFGDCNANGVDCR